MSSLQIRYRRIDSSPLTAASPLPSTEKRAGASLLERMEADTSTAAADGGQGGSHTAGASAGTRGPQVNGVAGMVELLASEGAKHKTVIFDFDSTLVTEGKVHSAALEAWVRKNAGKCWILTARMTEEMLQALVVELRAVGLAEAFGVPPAGDVSVLTYPDDGSVRVVGSRIVGTGPFAKGEVFARTLLAKLPGPVLFFDDNPYNAVELDALGGVSGYWVDLFDEWMSDALRLVDGDCAYKSYFGGGIHHTIDPAPHAPFMTKAEWKARREALQAHFAELAKRAGDEEEAADLSETARGFEDPPGRGPAHSW